MKDFEMKALFLFLTFFFIVSFIFLCSEPTKSNDENNFCQITDTTSHDFTWHTDTLGVFPSVLLCVAAIDEQNVWAVGEIWTPEPDTIWNTSNTKNNAIKWNGTDYEYYQIMVKSFGGSYGIQRLEVVLPFSVNDIWMFSVSGSYVHWNGVEWESEVVPGRTGTPNAAWGPSSDDFYIVGSNGSITHYDGTNFTLMESGTDIDLQRICGYIDTKTGSRSIWVAGDYILLHYDGIDWQTVWDDDNPLFPDGYNYPAVIYSPSPGQLLLGAWKPSTTRGYCVDPTNITKQKLLFETDVSAIDIDGYGLNDLIIVGSHHDVAHFNGSSIKEFPELSGSSNNRKVSFVNDHVFIVGPLSGQLGFFMRGKR
jgi:hypothetical protein